MDYSTLVLLIGLFPIAGCLVHFNYCYVFIEIPVDNANSVDPDHTQRSAASDLGLHCLPMSLFWDVRLKWIKPCTLHKPLDI